MNNQITKHYRGLLRKYGDTPEAVQWSNRESQFRRFAALARIGTLDGKRVLDYGCGTAAFAEFLASMGQVPSHYHGVDVVPEYFEYARKKVPHGTFGLPSTLVGTTFDYAFVSGVFNNMRSDARAFWEEIVKSLFPLCEIGLAFNLMSIYVDYRDPKLFYEDPSHVMDYIKREVSPFVTVCHDYVVKPGSVPFEFVVFVYKNPSTLRV